MNKNFLQRSNCELCNSNRKTILLSKEFTNNDVWDFLSNYYKNRINKNDIVDSKYEIAKCSNCGFIWQTYILNNEMMEKLYSNWISTEESLKKKKFADTSLFSGYAREVEIISKLIPKNNFEINVLDYGMGWGYWCMMAKAFGYNVSGFELSRDRIEFARKNGINVIENFPNSSYKFDFINAEQVFEHISNPLQVLKLLANNLKNNGIIKISVPNGRNIEKKLKNPKWKPSKNAVHPLEHINCFTHQTLINIGKLAGLKIIEPPALNYGNNIKSYIKGFIGKYYKKYFSTSLYFKKCEEN